MRSNSKTKRRKERS